MAYSPTTAPLRIKRGVVAGAVVFVSIVLPVMAQTSTRAPVVLPKPAVPERIDPIVTPLPTVSQPASKAAVRPVAARDKPGAAVVTGALASGKLPTCRPGERLQRKTRACQAIAGIPAKAAAKAAKPTPVPVKAAASKSSAPGKTTKVPARRG